MSVDLVTLALHPPDAVALRRLLKEAEEGEEHEVWRIVRMDLDLALRIGGLGEFTGREA